MSILGLLFREHPTVCKFSLSDYVRRPGGDQQQSGPSPRVLHPIPSRPALAVALSPRAACSFHRFGQRILIVRGTFPTFSRLHCSLPAGGNHERVHDWESSHAPACWLEGARSPALGAGTEIWLLFSGPGPTTDPGQTLNLLCTLYLAVWLNVMSVGAEGSANRLGCK